MINSEVSVWAYDDDAVATIERDCVGVATLDSKMPCELSAHLMMALMAS